MVNSSGSTHVDGSHGNVRDTHHNTNELRDSGDRRSGNSIADSSHSPSRNRWDRHKSRGMCNDATAANDRSVCSVELL